MKKDVYFPLLYIILGAFILSSVAFLNRYPIVYSDTGTYVAACFQKFIPIDRPIAYSFFIKHTSLAESLWLPIISQNLILSFLMFQFGKSFFKIKPVFHLVIISLLSIITSVSFICSELIPDIFTGILVIVFILLFLGKNSKWETLIYSVFFSFSLVVHFSNFIAVSFLIILLFVFAAFVKRKRIVYFNKIFRITFLMLIALFINPIIGYIYSGNYVFKPKGSHAFMIDRVYQAGILNDYLLSRCAKKSSIFCELNTIKYWDLLWCNQSPLVRNGGWMAVKKESEEILDEIFTNNKYKWWFIKDSFFRTFKELLMFDAEIFSQQLKGTPPYSVVHWHFNKELNNYLNSKQNRGEAISTSFSNKIMHIILPISLIMTFFLIYKLKNKAKILRKIFLIILMMIILNAMVCATFSSLDNRYTSRVIWLIPFFTLNVILFYYKNNKNTKNLSQ